MRGAMCRAAMALKAHGVDTALFGGSLYALDVWTWRNPYTGELVSLSDWVRVDLVPVGSAYRAMVDGLPLYSWLGY